MIFRIRVAADIGNRQAVFSVYSVYRISGPERTVPSGPMVRKEPSPPDHRSGPPSPPDHFWAEVRPGRTSGPERTVPSGPQSVRCGDFSASHLL